MRKNSSFVDSYSFFIYISLMVLWIFACATRLKRRNRIFGGIGDDHSVRVRHFLISIFLDFDDEDVSHPRIFMNKERKSNEPIYRSLFDSGEEI